MAMMRSAIILFYLSMLLAKPKLSSSLSSSVGAAPDAAHATPMIVQVESHIDWMETVEDFEQEDEISVVTFTSSRCKFCQRFKPRWIHKVVKPLLAEDNKCKFACVDFGTNKQLCRSLQIEALPTIQFYHQGELINSLTCGPKEFALVQDTLTNYLAMTSDQLQEEALSFAES